MTDFYTLIAWNAILATALASVVWVLSRMKAIECRPGLRHTLWMLVLLKLITPPVIPVPVLPSTGGGSESVAEHVLREPLAIIPRAQIDASSLESRERSSSQPSVSPPQGRKHDVTEAIHVPWPAVFLCLSLCGSVILLANCFAQTRRLSRLLGHAQPGNDHLTQIARLAVSQVGVRVVPVVRVVNAKVPPLLCVRFGRPVVVLPRQLVDELNDEQVSCVIRHETAHLLRCDHWTNALGLAVAALFWWHPVVWWARREMHIAQELCCDALALDHAGAARRCYAETLLKTIEFVESDMRFAAAFGVRFHSNYSVRRRFQMIADNSNRTRPTWWTYSLTAAFVLTALCLPVRATTPIGTATEAPDGNSSAAQPEKLQWGSELDAFKVRAEIEEGLWTEGKSSPLVSAFVKYRGPQVTMGDHLHGWLLEIDGTRYLLMIVSWVPRDNVNLTADRAFGIADPTHTVSFRFAWGKDDERLEVQRIEHGSVVNMYGLSAVDQNLHIRSGSPELVPGKHTLRIGFPVWMSNRSIGLGAIPLPDTGDDGVEAERESDGWAMSNPITFTIARQGKRATRTRATPK